MKYNPQKTVKLAESREAAGLTQDQAAAYFGLSGKKRRDTIGSWERGHSRPGLKHRARFISYLWDKLGLFRNRQLFLEIWQETAVAEWGWSPLGEGELPYTPAPSPAESPPAHSPLAGPFLAPPLPPHELVGRSELLHTLKQKLLRRNPQPIALTGLPGVGKTALALALAYDKEILAHFQDGILWAGLGAAPNIFAWLNKWGEALGLTPPEITRVASASCQSQRLHETIGRRRVLLVIDDAWRLEDALPFHIGGPNCAILLTTRRPSLAQDFAEENAIPVPELDKAGGLILFTRFAPEVAAALPSAVESLVTAVGGLPLALKLMARHTRKHAGQNHTSLQQIVRQLRDEKKRLTLAQPQRPSHPHPSLIPTAALSLSAILQISANAIDPPLKQALWTLSLFPPKPNTFSAAAAQEICAISPANLAALADYGLLEPGGRARYAMHQTVSDFARFSWRQVQAAGSHNFLDGAPARFAAYYQTILRQAKELYEQGGNHVRQGIQLFNEELENIHAGWQWAVAHSSTDKNAAHLCAGYPLAGGFLLHLRLPPQENIQWWQSGLKAARQIDNEELAAKHLANLGLIYRQIGKVRQALSCYREAAAFFERAGDQKNLTRTLNNMGAAHKTLSEFQQAIAYHEQALSLARQIDDTEQEGSAIANLGVVYKNLRQYDKAIEYQQIALNKARQQGHRYGEMTSLLDLGAAYAESKQYAQAAKFYWEALDKIRILGDLEHEGTVMCNLGMTFMYMGDIDQAITYYRRALEIDISLQNRPGELITRHNLGEAYEMLGEYDAALQLYNQSLEIARETGDKLGQGEALWSSARLLQKTQPGEAIQRGRQAEAIFAQIGDPRAQNVRQWLSGLDCSSPTRPSSATLSPAP